MSTNSAKTDLGTASVGKLLLRLSLPAIAAQIVNVLYNVVDRMYIGHLPVIGADALTGVGVVFPMIMIIAAFAVLISMGGAPRAAIYMGKGDNRTAEKILGNCAVALVILSVILTAAALLLAPSALRLFGASENTFKYAYQYMTIYAAGTLFVQLALGLNPFITTQGFAKTSMLTVFVGAGLNIVLDPIFMFVFHMGVAGAAWATILSQAVSAAWVLRFLTGSKSIIKIRRPDLHLDAGIILPCLALGVAPFIMQSSESVIAVSFNASLLKYGGDLAVGAMTILSSVMQFSMLPIMGLTRAASQ
jgi:putative MATE family efflux protein